MGILKETFEVDELAPFERLQQQAVDVSAPQILKETVEVTEYVAPAPAVTFMAPAPVIVHVSCTPDVTYAAPAPVIEHVALGYAVTYTAPAPVIEHVSSTPDVFSAAPAPVVEDVTPAPADPYTTPALVTDFASPSPVMEYSAVATSVTHVTPSERFSPAHTMAAVTTVVSLDTTGVVSPRCSTTAVQDSPLDKFAAPVHNQVLKVLFVAEETTQNSVEIPTEAPRDCGSER